MAVCNHCGAGPNEYCGAMPGNLTRRQCAQKYPEHFPVTAEQITRSNADKLIDAGCIEVAMKSGRWWAIRRNGQTKTWKSQPGRIRIPFKYGFKGYGAITTEDFNADGILDPAQYRVKAGAR